MTEDKLIDWIQLINTDGIGPVRFYKLLEQYGTAAESLKALVAKQALFSRKSAEYELEKAARLQVKIIDISTCFICYNRHKLNCFAVLFIQF